MAPTKAWLGTLLVGLLATVLLASLPLAGAQEAPPLEITDVQPDPPHEDITPETENVSFVAEIANNDGYNDDSTTVFSVDQGLVAEVVTSWGLLPPSNETVDSQDDPDRSGNWTPTIGDHLVNVSVYNEDDERLDTFELELPVGPDLVPTDVHTDAEAPVDGDTVTIEATVENQGPWDMPSAETVNVTLNAGGQQADRVPIDPLGAGDSTTVQLEWTAEAGNHTLDVRVQDEIDEVTTENNDATLQVDVEEADPQLALTNVIAHPDPAAPDETVAVQATLTNPGNAQTPVTTTRLEIDGDLEEETPTDPIGPGQQRQVIWEIDPDVGIHEITVTADADNDVMPATENLTMSTSLAVGPDLRVEDVQIDPQDPVGDDEVRFEATVENQGSPIDVNITVGLFQDETLLDDTLIDTLAQEGTQTVTLGPWTAQAGNHTFTITADPDQAISEADDANNDETVTLEVDPAPPDVALEDARLSEPQVDPGDEVPFEVTATNDGDTAAEDLTVRFALDEDLISEHALETLLPGAAQTVTSDDWAATQGTHTLTVTVGTQDELDADDPRDRATTDIAIGPDLEPTSTTLDPEDPTLGDLVLVNTSLQNRGTQQAGSFQVDLQADGDTVDEATLANLSPRTTATVQHEWRVTDDASTLTIVVDSRGDVDEVDETNNQLTRNVTVNANIPHLVAADLTADPENPEPGDNVTFVLDVINQGAAGAGTFEVQFLIEDDPHSTHTVTQLAREDNATVTSEPWQAEQGTVNVTAIVDPQGVIPQATTEDSERTLTLNVEEESLLPTGGLALVLASTLAALAARRAPRLD